MIEVTAAVIIKDGRILLARRKKGHHLEGKWEFPGGKIEECETPENCLQRELEEEFGIKTEIKEFIASSCYKYPHIEIKLMAYKVEYLSGRFNLTDHDKIIWVKPSEIMDYPLAPADIPLAEKILKY